MSTIPYANASQLMNLLKRQNLAFTKEQIRTSTFEDENGNTLKIRQGVIDEVMSIAKTFFSPNNAKRLSISVEQLSLSGRGRPSNSRDRLLSEKHRCYVVNTQLRTTVPTGDFFDLSPGSKVTAHFVDDSNGGYIKVVPHA